MGIPPGIRRQVRQRAGYQCEFCGIQEIDAGGELTIDHYHPRARGGGDDLDNLIYACSRCNLYKHDYWPESNDCTRLWNPRLENYEAHFHELADGTLESHSPTGAFTLRQLRLNRSQLIAYRLRRRRTDDLLEQMGLYQGILAVQSQLLIEHESLSDQQNELLRQLHQQLAQSLDS